MIESKIDFVEKYENPANLPECRPVEIFWAKLKSKVYAGGWGAKNLDELEKRIRNRLQEMDQNS